jgi:biotin carboxyl carrier protein
VKLKSGETSLTAELGDYELEDETTSGVTVDVPNVVAADTVDIKAPVVGYVAQGKQPAALGDPVKQGQPVFEVQALGIGNEAPAPISGVLAEVLVEPGKPVQFGQTIARVRRASE